MKSLSDVSNRLIGQPMFRLSQHVKTLETQGRKFIHFEIGDSNFDTPPSVIDSTIYALNNHKTHYTSSYGLTKLRGYIAQYTWDSLGFNPKIEQILVSPANAIIDNVIRCVANVGDEILIPNPGFPTYSSATIYNGMIPIYYECIYDINKLITDRTKLIIINSPNNPTGKMLSVDEITYIIHIAQYHGIYVLSDEVYQELVYNGHHHSLIEYTEEFAIVLNSLSKSHAMSGFRAGYAIGPTQLIDKMALLLQTTISCVPEFIQYGMITALNNTTIMPYFYDQLLKRRNLIVELLNKIPNLNCIAPDGGIYVWADISKTGFTVDEFCAKLLDLDIVVLSGVNFGSAGEQYIRMCFASVTESEIIEACERIYNESH